MSILNTILETSPTAQISVSKTAIVEPKLPEISESSFISKQDFFHVEKENLAGPYGDIPKKKGLFVNKKCINIVSDRYEIHQPKEIAQEFQRVADSHGLEITGCYPNSFNGGLLLSAMYANQKIAGEDHNINLVFYTSHDGKHKTFLTLDTLRRACYNQLPMLYGNKSRFIFSEKHYQNALDVQLIGKALENIPASIESHNEKLSTLKEASLKLSDFLDLWQDHYKVSKESKQFDSKIQKIKSIYCSAPGQTECPDNSAYKALQAVTYANTHGGRETALKVENSLIKGGNDSLVWLDELLEIPA